MSYIVKSVGINSRATSRLSNRFTLEEKMQYSSGLPTMGKQRKNPALKEHWMGRENLVKDNEFFGFRLTSGEDIT